MNANLNEHQPASVIDKIKARIKNGEFVEKPFATFYFPYLSKTNIDPKIKAEIDKLNLPEITISQTEIAIKELEIKEKLAIYTIIPENIEKSLIIPSLGIGGKAKSPTEIRYFFDPSHPNIIQSLILWKKRQIMHETNHIARMQSKKIGNTLLDAIISEGLATYYEEHLNNIFQKTPWGHILNQDYLICEWKLAQQELNSTNYSHQEWFFGLNKKHPIWTGYSLGVTLIESFMQKHPHIPMSKLVNMSSKDIFKKSGFCSK